MEPSVAKQKVAIAAREYVAQVLPVGGLLGVGTGTTAAAFIAELATIRDRIGGAVASSEATKTALVALGIRVVDLNEVTELPLYVDGADEIDSALHAIKGGGGAHTREKVVAAVAREFVCIADTSKVVPRLGTRSVPLEVVPMAHAYVARYVTTKLHAKQATLRPGFMTDNGNLIVDVLGLALGEPEANKRVETELEAIAGVVACGLFARRGADRLLVGSDEGVITYRVETK